MKSGSDDPGIQHGRLTFEAGIEGKILEEQIAKPARVAGYSI
jgi:hypothetical protein